MCRARASRRRIARRRLRDAHSAQREPGRGRLYRPVGPWPRGRRHCTRRLRGGRPATPRPGARSVRGGAMIGFRSPWLLLGLLLLGVAALVWVLAERRRMRYAVHYTNIDVLATVVSGRSWLRLVPPTLFLLGLASLLVALARPEVER